MRMSAYDEDFKKLYCKSVFGGMLRMFARLVSSHNSRDLRRVQHSSHNSRVQQSSPTFES